MVSMPPVLLSRALDTFLGLGTGFFAYYLYETHPRTAPSADERLSELLRWKYAQYQARKQGQPNVSA
ncbi:hypothetical protein FA13DRAFT_1727978 [Coprinellus micaceus]|uniref:Non-classical export protein 1 n=1 Tax=Coprinellus micaceus TaxID=71717 RepID=A0A4Y7TQC5_COPMI|nr:hypothetical protein FA13DRAFT_1727978 [Coprinellus micaceus]